ncbi:spore protease YyaC [Planococcus maitriensis]|nr:spore protease YyaC [Planococcus maitriensis]
MMNTFRRHKLHEVATKPKNTLQFNEQTAPEALQAIIDNLSAILREARSEQREIVYLCIGSDRYIGDSLGPLTGSLIVENAKIERVYGTLEEPIHAFNLKPALKDIQKTYHHPLIICVDASLGAKEQVGDVLFVDAPLMPGKALERMLPETGDYHFQGIVNYLDPLPTSQFLNDTRLHTVMKLSRLIARVITESEQQASQ